MRKVVSEESSGEDEGEGYFQGEQQPVQQPESTGAWLVPGSVRGPARESGESEGARGEVGAEPWGENSGA